MPQTLNFKKYQAKSLLSRLVTNGKSINNDIEMATEIHSFFWSVGKTLSERLPPPKKSNFKDYLRKKYLSPFFIKSVTEKVVLEFIIPIKNKESPGPDTTCTKILKQVAQTIITKTHKD